jgi:hypothetical protein
MNLGPEPMKERRVREQRGAVEHRIRFDITEGPAVRLHVGDDCPLACRRRGRLQPFDELAVPTEHGSHQKFALVGEVVVEHAVGYAGVMGNRPCCQLPDRPVLEQLFGRRDEVLMERGGLIR